MGKTRGQYLHWKSFGNFSSLLFFAILKEGIDKLVCHCARKPDKLDNIAKYLHKRLTSDLHHRNYA